MKRAWYLGIVPLLLIVPLTQDHPGPASRSGLVASGAFHGVSMAAYAGPTPDEALDASDQALRVAQEAAEAAEAIRVAQERERAVQRPSAPRSPVAPSGDILDQLAFCEAGGNPNTNTGNGYYGAFQFLPSTWRGIGYDGLPTDHPYEVQREAAQALIERSGWNQFPSCARALGML